MPSLRVSAGPDPQNLTVITSLVNTNKPIPVSSDLFEGQIVVNIKGFADRDGQPTSSSYFDCEERQGITWSFQVQGRFLKDYSADEILFGNTFDRPLHLPWGSGAALKFMNFVDPTLEHDLTSPTKPWALSPLITTMPHFAHTRLGGSPHASPASSSSSLGLPSSPPKFPPQNVLKDDTSMLYLAQLPSQWSPSHSASSSSSSLSSINSNGSRKSSSSKNYSLLSASKHKKRGTRTPINLETASQRRSYFSPPENRKSIRFGPNDIITTDFCYGFLEFSPTISLRIPGGLSFDLMKYWDGQPVRFVCCLTAQSDGAIPGNTIGASIMTRSIVGDASRSICFSAYNHEMASTPTTPRLSWIPLESNPEVFNGWAKQAGLDISKDSYNDIYSLDPDMIATIPRPVKAVIAVFPYAERRATRDAEDTRQQESGNSNLHEKVFWMKQRIRNACGAMGIVHSLANAPVTLIPDSPLSLFYAASRGKAPLERSAIFETTPEFAKIHSSVTTIGQCNLPENDEEAGPGYVAFVSYQDHDGGEIRVAELDGGRTGPIDRGAFNKGEDLLDAALRILKEDFIGKSGSIMFNVMYLGKPASD